MLAELVSRVRTTGGQIDQLDASFDSLVPLWQWFIQFVDAGCPGVPRTARSSLFDTSDPVRHEHPPTEELLVGHYAVQALVHHLRLCVARVAAPAPWSILVVPRAAEHHSVCVPRSGAWRLITRAHHEDREVIPINAPGA